MYLWSHARFDLRLSTAEFYSITSRQLDALTRRQQQRAEESEFLLAQIIASVINSRPWQKEGVAPSEFMPSEIRKKWSAKPKTIDRKLVIQETRKFMAELRQKQK